MLQILAIVLLIAMFGGIIYYVSARLYKGFAAVIPKLRFVAVWPIPALLTVIMVLGFASAFLPFGEEVKNLLKVIGFYWMGIFVYLVLFTLLSDLIIVILRLCKTSVVKKSAFKIVTIVLVLLLTFSTVGYGLVNAMQIDNVSYEIELPDKTDISDINIVMVSDLHLGALGSESRLEDIVDEINALKPDVLLIAGDFFDTDFAAINNPEKAKKTLNKIAATYGTYACFGNHDAGKTFAQMEAFMQESNIRVLKDESVIIDNRLMLVGRLDGTPIGGFNNEKRKELSSFFVKEDSNMPVIVLDHNPANINTYNSDVDLILSGHTHRGQIFPANIITDLINEVDYGYYRKNANSPQVVVTSGIGYWGMPMRVGSNSEIVSIRIK